MVAVLRSMFTRRHDVAAHIAQDALRVMTAEVIVEPQAGRYAVRQ